MSGSLVCLPAFEELWHTDRGWGQLEPRRLGVKLGLGAHTEDHDSSPGWEPGPVTV